MRAAQHMDETSVGNEAFGKGAAGLRRAAVDPGDDEIRRGDLAERLAQRDAVIVVARDRFDLPEIARMRFSLRPRTDTRSA